MMADGSMLWGDGQAVAMEEFLPYGFLQLTVALYIPCIWLFLERKDHTHEAWTKHHLALTSTEQKTVPQTVSFSKAQARGTL